MAHLFTGLSQGTWITRDRIIVYPAMMLVLTIAATAFVLWSNGGVMPNGAPFGTDFVSYWVAAREALAGNPLTPYDRALFEPAQRALFPDTGYFAFFYPPHYLAYMLPLGALPHYAALAAWIAVSFGACLWVLTRIAGNSVQTVVLALAFPAAFLTIAHGQNAFLSAALFGGGLYLLPKRPVLAGILFGLLTYKPQLGLLIPFALLAGGHWRAIISAGVTLGLLAGGSAQLFGAQIWQVFLAQSDQAMQALTLGWVGWHKMISAYASLRLLGVSDGAAMAMHAALAITVAACVVWAWLPQNGVAHHTKAALVLAGALIATPFGLNYDLYLLAPAMAFLAARGIAGGFLLFEKTVMAIAFAAPFVLLVAMSARVPMAPFVVLAVFALALRRALVERTGTEVVPAAIQPAE
ncbi:MAG: DUF2029 domain-containing protein [Roseitalea sp.]|jgi:hypothetical protein|nr:DUF2029 domain-containing protein [Roseitalea sp.]MBO6722384.1 DUF2029 domain-containing protein [Roseitalea sp.]MBO6744387.1 DUF2029 domain-containing protein [Roseitalea sp.]